MTKVVDIFNSVDGGYEDAMGNLTAPHASMVSDRLGIVNGVLTRFKGDGENLALYSEDLSQFGDFNCNEGGSITDIHGNTNTAIGMVADATANEIRYFYLDGSLADSNYVYSVFVHAGTKNWVYLRIDADNDIACYFNVSTGVVGTPTNADIYGIEDYGNGWYRCWIGGDLTGYVRIYAYGVDADTVDTSDSTLNDVLIYTIGYQIEDLGPGSLSPGTELVDQETLGSELTPNNTAVSDGQTEANATTGWDAYSTPDTFESSSSDKSTGTYSFHVDNNSGGARGFRNNTGAYSLTAGTVYKLTFDYKVIDGVGILLNIIDGDANVLSEYNTVFTETTWTSVTIYFLSLNSGTQGQLYFRSNNNDSEFYVDNISVKAVTAPNKSIPDTYTWPALAGTAVSVANGDFETAGGGGADVFATWSESYNGSDTITDETSNVHGGSHACKITNVDNGTTYLSASKSVTGNTLYRLSFWTRGDGSVAGRYRFWDTTHSTSITAITSTGITGTSYTEFVVYVYTPTDCVSMSIQLFAPSSAGSAYFDDVSDLYPIQISLTSSGNNTYAIDETENALTMTYVDNSNGGYYRLSDSTNLNADLVVGRWYRVTVDVKVNTAISTYISVYDGAVNHGVGYLTESWETYEIEFQAQSDTALNLRPTSVDSGVIVYIRNISVKEIVLAIDSEPRPYTATSGATATIGAEWPITDMGLQFDGYGVNLVQYSENFVPYTGWTNTNVTVTKNQTGPDGVTNSACSVLSSNNSSSLFNNPTPISVTPSTDYTFSCWYKGSVTNLDMRVYDVTNSSQIDILAIESSINNTTWTRLSLSFTTPGTCYTIYVYPVRDLTNTETVNIFGAQVEETPYMTSYIPTDGTPVVRTTMKGTSSDTYLRWTMSTLFKNLMGDVPNSPFTMVADWTAGANYSDLSGNFNILTTAESSYNILGYNSSGAIYTYNNSSNSGIDVDFLVNESFKVVIRCYDDSGMYLQFGKSEDGGETWVWDETPLAYSGAFTTVAYLTVGYSYEYPFFLGRIRFFDEALSQAQIEAEYYETLIEGDVTFGYSTGVTEENAETFANWWTGTGEISGSGDSEELSVAYNEVETSGIVHVGVAPVELDQNKYGSGDSATLYYRTGSTEDECAGADWAEYTVPFECLGYLQLKVEGMVQ